MGDQQGTVTCYPIVVQPVHSTRNTPSTTTTSTTIADENQQATMSNCEKRCIVVFIGLVVVVFLGYLICQAYLKITFGPPKFKVDSVTVHPLKISSSSHITANWGITFAFKNTNFDIDFSSDFECEDVKASICYKEAYISSMLIENFTLKGRPKWHKISADAYIGVSSMHINSSVAEAMAADLLSGIVTFTVTLDAKARTTNPYTGAEFFKSINVSCEKIKVRFLPNLAVGTMLDGPRKCHVRW